MTLEELIIKLPNGLHDARLMSLSLDYVTRSAVRRMQILGVASDGGAVDNYKVATLRITGLCFCTLELPFPDEPFVPDSTPINVSGYPEEPQANEKPNRSILRITELLARCPPSAWSYRVFSHNAPEFVHSYGWFRR